MLSIIVATAKNNIIGKEDRLLWYIPEDLKRFKQITLNKTIIMGRKTFDSIGRVLPDRKHIILTKSKNMKVDNEKVEIINDVKFLEKYIYSSEEHFVIGGQSIYSMLLPYTNKLYMTSIDCTIEGETRFPEINPNEWKLIKTENGVKSDSNAYDYKHLTYVRKNHIAKME